MSFIHDLITMPAYRGRGISSALINYMENKACEIGCSRIVVHTKNEKNLADGFYDEKLDFERYATVLIKETS